MPKYRVYLQTVASTVIEVEADDKEEALEAAYQKGMPTICAQCSGWGGQQNLDLNDAWEAGDNLDEAVEEVTSP